MNPAQVDYMNLRAMLRPGRFETAVSHVRPYVVRGWPDRSPLTGEIRKRLSADESFADLAALNIIQQRRRRRGLEVPVSELVLPPWEKMAHRDGKGFSRLFAAVRFDIENFSGHSWGAEGWMREVPDEVVEVLIDDRRTVYLHSYVSRLVQKMWILAVETQIDATFSPYSHAYRPNRSRFTAMTQVRQLVCQGYRFAIVQDIEAFFPSIRAHLVDAVLQHDCPWMGSELRTFGLRFLFSPVVRRPRDQMILRSPTRPEGCLLQGSIVAPLLANLVANHFIDRPFELVCNGEAVLLRYSDDLLLLAKSAAGAVSAFAILEKLLETPGFRLNETKGSREPVDLVCKPVVWLGKRIHGTSVLTPDEKIAEMAGDLAKIAPETGAFKACAKNALNEMCLDGPGRVERVFERALKKESRIHVSAFRDIARSRPRIGYDLPPDEQAYWLAADAESREKEIRE